ncbi:MAG TPA: alpha/beta hydrolase [Polyangiaceae bacterium]|nr:alpha/beta hydrolase [Polyangiaceae bacterium]
MTWLSLLRWLGPWAGERVPAGVGRERRTLRRDVPVDAYVYRAARGSPRGVWVVAPGMHFLGPDDPRMDRFCRVLGRAGFVVVAPLLSDFLALRLARGSTEQLATAVDHAGELARERGVPGPALLSISFGSMPAIEVAAREAAKARVSRLVLFGGFCDFEATVRHAVLGERRDPLNSPVVFSNLIEHLDLDVDRAAVLAAWRAMVERTWGRMELKAEGARDPIAHEIARGLGDREQALFLAGCGLDPSSRALLERGLERARGRFEFTDPRPWLARLGVPVTIVHGRDDDVIPVAQAHELARALPPGHPHEVLLTGFYGHTGSAVPSPRALASEVRTLTAILGVLASP